MNKPKVLISDKMDPNAARIFEERGCDVDVKPGITHDAPTAVTGHYDGLPTPSATNVTSETIAATAHPQATGPAAIRVPNRGLPYPRGQASLAL